MRLGAYPARAGARAAWSRAIYGGAPQISERHRHRYEVNIHYREQLEEPACASPACRRTACCRRSSNIPDHPWFIGVQYHPGAEIQALRAAPAVHRLHRRRGAPGRGLRHEPSRVAIGGLTFGNDLPFTLIAGPCQIEIRDHAMEVAARWRSYGQAARHRR